MSATSQVETPTEIQTEEVVFADLPLGIQDNILRQHREGGFKLKTQPILKGKVDRALEPQQKVIDQLNEALAKVEAKLDSASGKALEKARDRRKTILGKLVVAKKVKRTAREANSDNGELVHARNTVRASEWFRMQTVTGILGQLKYEERRDTDDAEIASFTDAQAVAKAQATVSGVLDLSDFL